MKLVLVGTGLIGSAFALGAKRASLFSRIEGLDTNAANAETALKLGVVDALVETVPSDADAVLLAMPSSHIADWVVSLATHSGTVFDVGSVKGVLVEQIQQQLEQAPANYVPCHPIAGLERSGPAAARGDLFNEHRVVITPLPGTNASAVSQVQGWWEQVGAVVEQMDPWEHDLTFATTSHLPHLVAFAYMQQVASAQLPYAAGGFRDFSRIAAADPDMWSAVLTMNGPAVTSALSRLQADLAAMKAAIGTGDHTQLRSMIQKSQERRQEFDEPQS